DGPRAPNELRIRLDEQADIGKLEPLPQAPLDHEESGARSRESGTRIADPRLPTPDSQFGADLGHAVGLVRDDEAVGAVGEPGGDLNGKVRQPGAKGFH